MEESRNLIERIREHTANHYDPLEVVLSRGDGSWVWDINGKRYMDMLSCYSALNLGYNHRLLNKAILNQVGTGLLACSNAVYNDKQVFNERLARFCGFEKTLAMNTGAEAVEAFLKLARKWFVMNRGEKNTAEQGDPEIIVCKNNFHGRTTTIISFSSEMLYKDGFGPLTPGFMEIPFGDIKALSLAINKNTAAFLVEPIQGEGGIIIPPKGYLSEAKRLCKEEGVLFALDEIQTGWCRTGGQEGQYFVWQQEDAKPDVLILGKSLGSYTPVSAMLTSAKIMDSVYTPGTHGSTFSNNALGCALGLQVIDIFEKDKTLPKRVTELGNWFIEQLSAIKSPYIREVRGRGLFIGIELKESAGGARRFCEMLLSLEPVGIICKETHEHVLRFAPPLTVTKENLEWALEQIRDVLTA